MAEEDDPIWRTVMEVRANTLADVTPGTLAKTDLFVAAIRESLAAIGLDLDDPATVDTIARTLTAINYLGQVLPSHGDATPENVAIGVLWTTIAEAHVTATT